MVMEDVDVTKAVEEEDFIVSSPSINFCTTSSLFK